MLGLKFSRHVYRALALGALTLPACSDSGDDSDGAEGTTSGGSAGDSGSTGIEPGPTTSGTGGEAESSDTAATSDPTTGAAESTGAESTGGGSAAVIQDAEWLDPSTVRLTFSEAILDIGNVDPRQFRLSWAITDTYAGPLATYYADVGYWEETEAEQALNPIVSVAHDEQDASVLLLTLTRPISQRMCDAMANYKGYWSTAENSAIYVHYAATGIPEGEPLLDESGDAVESIGAPFVVEQADDLLHYALDAFPHMSTPVPMVCPLEPTP